MPLIKDGRLADDPWIAVDDDTPLPEEGHPVVSLDRWRRDSETLARRPGPLGIRLRSDQSPAELASELDRFSLVALEFPTFRDGRAYSSARLLRERHDFKGELRAVGDVLRDQFLFMARCGFDSLEVADTSAFDHWQQALSEVSVFYQPTGDGRSTVTAERHRRPARALSAN